ncbi:unnamed protein product [Lepeophtheirus salmonis]|uniref:(salmon louse) hypothetical protein n=1 Tax=Lepeophtheirus salmonis TaxID=72036 RepID=A0A7R8H1W7_LEPSM|nr:unnamed protein product [Lepeophtheirus salmonis]CAF2802479.1 unnamed protein product [Lepeophtheirus salmonis]
MPKSNEVPRVVGQFKVCPKGRIERGIIIYCVPFILDPFDDESEDTFSTTRYSDPKAKLLDEHKKATQDNIERLFQFIEAAHINSIEEIMSLARDYLSNVPDVREAIITSREEFPQKQKCWFIGPVLRS